MCCDCLNYDFFNYLGKNTKTALIGGLSIIFYIILLVVISTKFIVKM